jgi:hypothetical protein
MFLHGAATELREQTACAVRVHVREQLGIVMGVTCFHIRVFAQLLRAASKVAAPRVLPSWQV